MPNKRFVGGVLALDLATLLGWAHGKPGTVPTFGHVRLASAGASRAEIYRSLRQWLETFTREHEVALISYESPATPVRMAGRTNIRTIRLLIGLAENLEEWSHDRVELREASVAEIRAFFIGGNPRSAVAKSLTMARCRDLGWACKTPDEADAAALWALQTAWLDSQAAIRMTPLFRG